MIRELSFLHSLAHTFTRSELFNPGHYVAFDHSQKAIVVAIRGTFDFKDILVDMTGRNVEYQVAMGWRGVKFTLCFKGWLGA